VSSATVSVLLLLPEEPQRLSATLRSIRAQTVAAEVVLVCPSDERPTTAEVDRLVDVPAREWTFGRALNAGATVARAPVHATVVAGRELPRADWLERVLAHHERPDVAGASGARFDRDRRVLLEPRDVRAPEWSPTWGFSAAAAGWRASTWARHPFPDTAPADQIWGWDVLRNGLVLVVDPFLQLEGSPPYAVNGWSIFRRTAEEWSGLLAAGAPVIAPSFREALEAWWRHVDTGVAAPAALQRVNYFRLARELGRWAGGRRAAAASGRRGRRAG
jgi:hypothetical protein